MVYRTKEEMFGDGAGFGTMVPVDTGNPSGYATGNRGIGFGEQLTSAIANRTHYALAENDEDLESRVSEYEMTGLDAAYRLGAVATAGGGRVITLDGGPVETQSSLITPYADDPANAHYRANALSDGAAARSSTGFDFVSDHDPSGGGGLGTGWAGFLDRRAYGVFNTGSFLAGNTCTLNPGSAGGTIIRTTTASSAFYVVEAGPTPPAGNYTALMLGVDLIEISGTSSDGLYVVHGLGSAANEIVVRTLQGASPSFGADDTGTYTVYRPALVSTGTELSGSRSNLQGSVMAAPTGSIVGAALSLYGGTEQWRQTPALRIKYSGDDGSVATALSFDRVGRQIFSLLSEEIPYDHVFTEDLSREDGGAFATKVLRTGSTGGSAEFGHIVMSEDTTVQGRYDFTSLTPFTPAGVTNLDLSIPFSFNLQSPSQGELDLSGASLASVAWELMTPYGLVVEILTGAAGTPGFYILDTYDSVGELIYIRDLDHSLPSHFPTATSGTLRFYSLNRLGWAPETVGDPLDLLPDGIVSEDLVFGTLLSTGLEEKSTALALFTPGNPGGGEDRSLLRAFIKTQGSNLMKEILSLKPGAWGGAEGVLACTNFMAHEGGYYLDGSTSEVIYGEPDTPALRSRTSTIPLNLGAPSDNSGTLGYQWVNVGANIYTWAPTVGETSPRIFFPIQLPRDAELVGVDVMVDLNTGRAAGQGFTCSLHRWNYAWGTPGVPSATTLTLSGPVTSVDDDGTADPQIIVCTLNAVQTFSDTDDDVYYLQVEGPTTPAGGDYIYAVRIRWNDPGPRNY